MVEILLRHSGPILSHICSCLIQFSCNVVLSAHVHVDVFAYQCLREETIVECGSHSTTV